jgi:putative ABC transport system permease protein
MIDFPFYSILWMYVLLIIPAAILHYFRIALFKEALIAITRMTIQLVLVGLYLQYVFDLNNPLLTLAWVFVMLVVANTSILGKTGLRRKLFFFRLLGGITISTILVTSWFIIITVQPTPIYDAQYIVPIFGMILGNCMSSNVLSMERFYSGIKKNETEFMTYILLGASLNEAITPYLRDAIKAALAPTITNIATMGIVSLPGMMTGQILGGASPLAAIEYQICIMMCIFVAMVIASTLNIYLSLPLAFDQYKRLKPGIFK